MHSSNHAYNKCSCSQDEEEEVEHVEEVIRADARDEHKLLEAPLAGQRHQVHGALCGRGDSEAQVRA